MRPLAVGLLTAFALMAAAAPAPAERIDRAAYERLLNAAPGDPAALERLRGVTVAGGVPVDLRRVLAGSDARVRARLRALRASGSPAARDATADRRSAAAILAGSDYRKPRPGVLARLLSWLAGLLAIPSGASGIVGLIALGGVVAAIAALAALAIGSARRARVRQRVSEGAAGTLGVGSASAEELDGRADAAEAAGRYEDAIRLRLAAALTRLDAAGAVRVRRDTTVDQVARTLRSQEFDAAAVSFSGVVYGRRPATADDALELRRRLAATVAERSGA